MDTSKEKRAIQYLKAFEPKTEPYYLCYSGGKDSDVIRILAKLANVKHDIVNNHTTVDAPETVRYIKKVASENDNMKIVYPEKSMWRLIEEKGVPTRLIRFCCAELKEKGGSGRVKITGVRKAESANRKNNQGLVTFFDKRKGLVSELGAIGANFQETAKGGVVLNIDNSEARRAVESCCRTHSTLINPIIDWTDEDVWEFLHHYGCESNPLYQCGYKRIGCIGCPMKGGKKQKEEFKRYSKYKDAYIRSFDRMLTKRAEKGKRESDISKGWFDGEHVYRWWVGDDQFQITMFDYYDSEDWDYFNNEEAMP